MDRSGAFKVSKRSEGGGLSDRFANKVALVAGVARPPGLGFALAKILARDGARVICIDATGAQPEGGYDTGITTPEQTNEIAREVATITGFDEDAVPILVETREPTAWATAVGLAIKRCAQIDIGCAFMGSTGPESGDGLLVDLDPRSWQRCLDANLSGPLYFAQAVIRQLIATRRPGALCLLSSYSAVVGPRGFGAIAAARAGLQHLVEVLALEAGPHSIRVNAVAPLSVANPDPRFPNPGLTAFATNPTNGVHNWALGVLPLGRPQSPEETAEVAAFLCSQNASFISGVTVPVAGGMHTHS